MSMHSVVTSSLLCSTTYGYTKNGKKDKVAVILLDNATLLLSYNRAIEQKVVYVGIIDFFMLRCIE